MSERDLSAGPGATLASAGTDDGETAQVNVGVLVAPSPQIERDQLYEFARQMVTDATDELHAGTDIAWQFVAEEAIRLPDNAARRPSQFLDEAMDRITDGPYDLIVVATDVSLLSQTQRSVPGLASSVSRVIVVSTRKLVTGPREEPVRQFDAPAVRWNAATLLLHLLGQVLGAKQDPASDGVMAPFDFDPARRETPDFDADTEAYLQRIAREIPETESSRGRLGRLAFHIRSAVGHPGQILDALGNSQAFRFPLSLPKLTTTALTPTLVIIFSAESWDVALHLSNATAALFAGVSILAAAGHLMFVQNLFFPRRRRQALTEHMALMNVIVFTILIGAMIGLFVLVASVMLIIEFVVFPPQLMADWPSLEDPTVGVIDRIRTAAFIATLGMLSGALAGGLENRMILRHLALFNTEP